MQSSCQGMVKTRCGKFAFSLAVKPDLHPVIMEAPSVPMPTYWQFVVHFRPCSSGRKSATASVLWSEILLVFFSVFVCFPEAFNRLRF